MVAQKINVQIQPVKTNDTAGQEPRPLVSCRLFLFVRGTLIAIFDHVIAAPPYGSLGNPNIDPQAADVQHIYVYI